jgi:D,D-heptose 1,7-bisphosphate phosphatase
VNQAVIFCGGFGKRLGKLAKKTPKPLIKCNDRPFIENIILQYSRANIRKILLLCSYKSNLFKKRYHNKKLFGCDVKCFIEKKPSGTAGALRKAKKYLDDEFFLSNGDTLVNFNILLLKRFLKKSSLISIAALQKKTFNKRYGGIKFFKNNSVSFVKENTKYINTGYCFVKKKLVNKIKISDNNFEKDFLKNQNKKLLKGIVLNQRHNFFLDIGTPKDLVKKEKFVKKFNLKKAVFLDRDGVINKDFGYVHNYKQLKYINNIKKAIKLLNDNNFYVFVVTNQSGVGRGYYSSKDVIKLHKLINKDLNKECAYIDEFVFAPYYIHSKIKFSKKDQMMRKPNTGMVDYLFDKWQIIRKESIIIGDKESDKKLSINCKIKYLDVSKGLDLYTHLKKKLKLNLKN